MISKVHSTPAGAVAELGAGARIAVGGFGLCGIPDALIQAIAESTATNLEVFSNNCAVDVFAVVDVTGHGTLGVRELAPGVALGDLIAATDAPLDLP